MSEPVPTPPVQRPYWHPICTKCKRAKNRDSSHCPSRSCPWCGACARTAGIPTTRKTA